MGRVRNSASLHFLPRLQLGHITWYIWLHSATPKFLPLVKTSDIPETLYAIAPKRHMLKYLATNVKGENNYG